MTARSVKRGGKAYKQNTHRIGRRKRTMPPVEPSSRPAVDAAPNDNQPPETAAPVRRTRTQRIDRLARLTLSFIEATKHFAHLIGWLGETANEFDEAELLLSNVCKFYRRLSVEIERKAVAADPLNASPAGHPGAQIMTSLKVLSGALDELTEGQIVLRGVIDPASLGGLLKPDYQRETLRKATIEGLMSAFRDGAGRVPDVELAVRGERYGCTDSGGTYTITGDVFIIDGLQRISAAKHFAADGGKPLVGAMIHFGTTEEWKGAL